MFNVGGGELLVILLVALIVLGPNRLPGAAKSVGRVVGDLRRMSSGFQQELRQAFDDAEADAEVRSAPAPGATPIGEVVRELEPDAPAAPAGEDTTGTGQDEPDRPADGEPAGPEVDGGERAAS